jgi:ribosomal protein S27AE
MPEIHEYYCSKCGTKVKESNTKCPKCKSFLASDGNVKVKKINISEIKVKEMENIYKNNFKNFSKFTKEEKEKFKKHNINSTFPVWVCIILHFITLGIFTLIYFGIKHGKLPQINEDDPTTGQAIGFMFIPFYNFYWRFFYWLRMTDRINLQYKIRGKELPISRTFVLTVLWLSLIPIPFVWHVGIIILMPIVIGKIQSASNELVNNQ